MLNGNGNHERHDVVIVGGGLAGLSAAAYLARTGRQVTVLEKGRRPGGRARTRERDGYLFNLGPHALFAGGPGADVLRELGVSFDGRMPPLKRIHIELEQRLYGLPGDVPTLLKTRLLGIGEKVELSRLMMQMPKVDPRTIAGLSTREWIEQLTPSPQLQQFLYTLIRAASYSTATDELSAAVALGQLQLILGENVRYLDGGWQTLVDGLQRVVEDAGGIVESSSRVANIAEDGAGISLRLADGRRLQASAAVLAVSPRAAARLVPDRNSLHAAAISAVPVRFASLDLALRRLPRPDRAVVFAMERPLYLSVHSEFGRLAPEGAAVVHLGRYLDPGESGGDESEMEMMALMDRVQPGWRDEVVTRRFMRQNTVVNWLPGRGGLRTRPGVRVPCSDRLFLAGDWVGATGWLADGSLASGREAAHLILKYFNRRGSSPCMPGSTSDDLFATYRSLLFNIAYRMLGSAMDAEDMVQEAYLRWQRAGTGNIEQPRAFLTTIITRLCIDHLRSAQVQRESYIGPWLPEPILTAPGGGPAESVAERESLSLAFLVMLERLSPVERAAFQLREVFAHGYDELAQILETSEANARQLVSRSRRKLDGPRLDRLRFAAVPEQQASLAQEFVQAIGSGDVNRVLNLLAPEVAMVADGGGKVAAARRPITGAPEVTRFFLNLARMTPPGMSGAFTWVNGALAIAIYEGDVATILLAPVVEDGRITTLYALRNPDKLAFMPRLAEVTGAFPLG